MFTQEIAEGLTLRSMRDDDDKERFAAFNGTCNNPGEGSTCACLLHHHPEMTPDDFWIVESQTGPAVVSTTCLIPWTLRFTGLMLRAAQLEMVLTHPDYRGRGLIRTQMRNFEQVVKSRGFDLSFIWGIPYYYRQYGYAYAIEGETREALPVWKVPAGALGTGASVQLRPARLADIPRLTDLHDAANTGLDLSIQRTPTYWRYLLEAAQHPVEVLESAESGEALGFAVIRRTQRTASIAEHSLPDAVTALALLQALGAGEQVQISWPASSTLAALARQLGSQTIPGGQWLLRIPDMASFLNKLRPVFDQRLASSDWRTLSADITINLFREAFRLSFEQGKLLRAEALGFVDSSMGADGGHLCIPPEAFLRLLFGYRALDELFDAWPDILVKPEARSLLNTLFPRLQPFLYTAYQYLGVQVPTGSAA